MSKLITRRWQNGNSKNNGYGKYYQRVLITETLSTEDFAKHIASHGSPYTRDVIIGVLMAACDCLVELTLDSKAVRLSDLGIFKMGVHAEGATDADKATADKVQRVELQFLPNQSKAYNLSSTELRKKAEIVGIDQLGTDVTDGFSSPSSNSGSTSGSNSGSNTGSNSGSSTGGNTGSITGGNSGDNTGGNTGDNTGGGDNNGGGSGAGGNGDEN